MKFLLLVFVVLMGVWLWRSNRLAAPKPGRQEASAANEPQDMVSCAFCGTHVPAGDAIQGKEGIYCSAEHLARAEP